jgi:hypothetical protein
MYTGFGHMSTNPDNRASLPIPMVYEQFPAQALRWEYHVLTIDPREETLPLAERLNELGREGWILVGVLDESTTGKGGKIQYYFTRQLQN